MPIYEYSCGSCSRRFELLIRGDETPSCPDCGTAQLEKLLSVPAAHTSSSSDLPICDAPQSGGPCGMGGCGLPECG